MDAPAPRNIQRHGFAPAAARGKLWPMRMLMSLWTVILACFGVGCAKKTVSNSVPPPAAKAGTVRHVDASGAAQLIAGGRVLVLDIRTPAEYAEGHVKNAKLINYQSPDFATNVGKLNRGQAILVHCASGRRSTNCLETFAALGFTNVIHLDGGYKGWVAAGQPVEK